MVYVKMVNKIIIIFMFISRPKRNRRQLVMPFWGEGWAGAGEGGKHYVLSVKMVIVYHLQKKIPENPVGKKWNTTFWVVLAENFW